MNASVAPVENTSGSLVVYYMRFRNVNFPRFLPNFFAAVHVIEWYVEAEFNSISQG
jgi:hypothetical protein